MIKSDLKICLNSAGCPPGAVSLVDVALLTKILVVRKTFPLAGPHFLLVVAPVVPVLAINNTRIFLQLIRIVGQSELDAPVDPNINGLENNVSVNIFRLEHKLTGGLLITSTEWFRCAWSDLRAQRRRKGEDDCRTDDTGYISARTWVGVRQIAIYYILTYILFTCLFFMSKRIQAK